MAIGCVMVCAGLKEPSSLKVLSIKTCSVGSGDQLVSDGVHCVDQQSIKMVWRGTLIAASSNRPEVSRSLSFSTRVHRASRSLKSKGYVSCSSGRSTRRRRKSMSRVPISAYLGRVFAS
jgi:hypothetical protein